MLLATRLCRAAAVPLRCAIGTTVGLPPPRLRPARRAMASPPATSSAAGAPHLEVVDLANPGLRYSVVLAHAGFIMTVEDAYEALFRGAPGAKFGVAFNEASAGHGDIAGEAALRPFGDCAPTDDACRPAAHGGPVCASQSACRLLACRLPACRPQNTGLKVRSDGNDAEATGLARDAALAIGAGHTLVAYVAGAYPVTFMPALKALPEVAHVWAATGNPLSVVLATHPAAANRKAVVGVMDGSCPDGLETPEQAAQQRAPLRELGYKR